jgi:hypothetical protein
MSKLRHNNSRVRTSGTGFFSSGLATAVEVLVKEIRTQAACYDNDVFMQLRELRTSMDFIETRLREVHDAIKCIERAVR